MKTSRGFDVNFRAETSSDGSAKLGADLLVGHSFTTFSTGISNSSNNNKSSIEINNGVEYKKMIKKLKILYL